MQIETSGQKERYSMTTYSMHTDTVMIERNKQTVPHRRDTYNTFHLKLITFNGKNKFTVYILKLKKAGSIRLLFC